MASKRKREDEDLLSTPSSKQTKMEEGKTFPNF